MWTAGARPSRPRIVIVGAGMGGLSAATLLARDFDVCVVERAARPGGKIRTLEIDGGAIDAGPTVFTMRWVFEELFAAAGASFDEAVRTAKLDVIARHFWRDGSRLDLHADRLRSAAAIREFAGEEEARLFLAFCDRTRRIYEALRDPFIRAPKPSLANLVLRRNPLALLGIDPFQTVIDALSKQFRDTRLRQLFARYATYCGSSPYEAPATLLLIAHVEQEGVWSVTGGMQAVAAATAGLGEGQGAAFRYGAHVSEIIVEGARASGVALSTGEIIKADAVLFNGEPAALAAGLLGGAVRNAVVMPRDAVRSQSAITWTLGVDVAGLDLSTHNVFFSDHYRSEFDAVFRQRRAPATPTTYVFAPGQENASCSRDRQTLFCLVNAPPAEGPDAGLGDKEIEECRQRMFSHLKACGLALNPQTEITATSPADFAAMFPGSAGALYGMASHGWRASFQRPGARTRVKGLYLAGGGAHPGPGVPMAALSGMAAAAAIRKDFVSM